ncbi:MAG: zinc ribbon domain-containing protein [Azonexus sp.]
MALTKCHECGAQVSTKANACPSCGAKVTRTSFVTKMVALIVALVVVMNIGMAILGRKADDTKAIVQAKSPEKIEAEKQAKVIEEKKFNKTLIYAASIKKQMRNPASFDLEFAGTNEDASVICIKYRGQNGFGGKSIETVVVIKDRPHQDATSFNKHCAGKDLTETTAVKHLL